jgi:predicted RNA binding protein YcfA (HicA-like mRNA interferase family)
VLSGRDVVRLLEQHGFRQVRQRGSHIVMQRVLAGRTTTIPVPDHPELKRGTMQSIIRQSGIPREAFETD